MTCIPRIGTIFDTLQATGNNFINARGNYIKIFLYFLRTQRNIWEKYKIPSSCRFSTSNPELYRSENSVVEEKLIQTLPRRA